MANHLSQLASQLPRFINEHSKRRRDPNFDLSQFFDFKAFYPEEEPSSPGTRTRSVASSEPGLTSGPSEEDGAPSPGPSDDSFQSKDTIRQVKQHDDRFTLPEREIRPKGGLPYPSKIHLDNAQNPTGPSPTGNNVMILSNPGSPTIYDADIGDNQPLHRGRRNRPLENREKVAVMRKLGACYRCKLRKVSCDEEGPCSNCIKAAKNSHASCDNLAEQMCFRHPPNPMFRDISRLLNAENSPRPHKSTDCTFSVFFQQSTASSRPLMLNVERDDSSHFPGMGSRQYRYTLSANEAGHIVDDIVRWAESQMKSEKYSSLQSALDNMAIFFAGYDGRELPDSDLLRKVHRLRCLYKAWRQDSFLCQKQPGAELEKLPYDIYRSLRALLARVILGFEDDVLKNLSERKPLKSQKHRVCLWACWMQTILLYRDLAEVAGCQEPRLGGNLQRRAEGLMNYAVVMCDLHFTKRPAAMTRDETNASGLISSTPPAIWLFETVESKQMEFFAKICEDGLRSDKVLRALLIKPQKSQTRPGMPAQKRARRST